MRHELAVWLFADWVGVLGWQEGQLQFAYRADWLARDDARPLSHSLPLQAEPFGDAVARPFFAGLLPEGHLRTLLARQFHFSRHNDFALLEQLGGECAGAVGLWPLAQPPAPRNASVDWLDEARWAKVLTALPQRPMLAGERGLRLSLAGAQDKLPVVVQDGRVGLPLGDMPSTHILKPAIAGVADSVLNEAFCLALAQRAGLPSAAAQVATLAGQTVLLVQRYDRQPTADGVQRLHQEDFCQALGQVPEAKYQNEGGPDSAQCFALLRRATRPSAPAVLRLLDAVIFNALIGNHDAHGKNFSLLYASSSATLAPLYDLLCTAVYPQLSEKMAMKLGGKYRFDDVLPRHWQQFAQEAGLAPAAVGKRVRTLARSLPALAQTLQAEAPFADSALVAQIVELLQQRAVLTERRFGEAG